MAIKYHRIILNGYSKDGLLYAPSYCSPRFAVDGVQLPDMTDINFTLKDGYYADYMGADVTGRFVSERLKNLFQSYLKPFQKIEFMPILVKSNKYDDRTYYLMHFNKVYDVIDKENSVYIAGTDSIIKPVLDYHKIKDLDIFNLDSFCTSLVVSETVGKEMKKKKDDRRDRIMSCLVFGQIINPKK